MFGLEFLFVTALWALPLASLPLVLHLLFRRKSPVVPFSTLRFIQASLKQTAARRRVRRWLLLACRILLLALLIMAVSQPAKRLASAWGSGASSIDAAIIVDTSYSMLYQGQTGPLLNVADQTVRGLLRGPLSHASVAIFKSQPPPSDAPEHFDSSADVLAQWAPLTPQANPVPLVDRVIAAVNLLHNRDAAEKWLIIVSDLQKHEFARPLPDFTDGHVVIIDLHPDDARSVGISEISVKPPRPMPGVGCDINVLIDGRGAEVPVDVDVADLTGKSVAHPTLPMAKLTSTPGTAQVAAPVVFPDEPWLLVRAKVDAKDAADWNKTRQHLMHLPPPRPAAVIGGLNPTSSERVVRLALDPTQGSGAWPIALRPPGPPRGDEDLIVAILTDWPDVATARQYLQAAQRGSVVMLFVKPGLEESWASLLADRRAALTAILPSEPGAELGQPAHAAAAEPDDPLLGGLTQQLSDASRIVVLRCIRFSAADSKVTALLTVTPTDPSAGKGCGLLWRRSIGAGSVLTWCTLPDSLYSNLATSEMFLPILVNASLRQEQSISPLNVEIGHPIILAGPEVAAIDRIEIETPNHERYVISPTAEKQGRQFVFTNTAEPGLYTWRRTDQTQPIWYTNVQLPADESDLDYATASTIAQGPNVLIARSLDELTAQIAAMTQPQPHWSGPIAVVILLLCFESMMASTRRVGGA
jgi:hypothetical protein